MLSAGRSFKQAIVSEVESRSHPSFSIQPLAWTLGSMSKAQGDMAEPDCPMAR